MKKWLVGLMAAGLCAASAWAKTNTVAYFVQNKAVTVMQGEAPEGSSAIYSQTYNGTSGQATGGTRITLTLTGYEGTTVTGLRLAMHSNSKAGAGSLSATCGDAVIGSIADAPFNDPNWYGAWSQIFVDVTVPVTPTVIDDDIFITIAASSNSLYCEEFYIDYIPAVPTFSVSLDPGDDFTAVLDTPTDIRAIAENATGSVEYAWTLDGEPTDVLGDTFTVDTSVSGGSHEVVCVATDTGTGATSEASVNYTVVGAYTVTVADGIENGSVAVWDGETELASPTDVLEGTVLKVVATPATRSYKVESVTVTGEDSGEIPLENGEFTMPAENVSVTATFVERSTTAYALVESMADFEDGADYLVVAGSDAMKNEPNGDRIAVEAVSVEDGTVETEDPSIVWQIAAGAAEGQYTLYNAAANVYVSAPSYESTGAASLVEDGTVAEAQWTLSIAEDSLATIGSVYDGISLQRNSSHPYFAAYKGETKPSLYKKVGAGVFSISLDPSGEDVVFTEGEGGTITASAKNAQGAVTYTWNWTEEGPGSASEDGSQWVIPADAPTGSWTLYCSAKDEVGNEADASVRFSIVGAPVVYEVTVDEGIEHGDVSVDPASGVAGTVIAVTAIPHEGYRCDGIYVNGDPIDGLTFELPEGGATVSAVFVESNTKTATYTVVSKTEVETTGEAPTGSTATFECNGYSETQLTGGTHMILTLKGYEGATLTGLTLSMKSNGRSGAGSLGVSCGEAVIGEIADAPFSDDSWNGSFSGTWVDIAVPVTPTLVDDDVVIFLSASANSLYCQSFRVEYEPGTPEFGVALDPSEDFEVAVDEEATVTATAKNAIGEVTFAWTVDGVAADTQGDTLALDTSAVGGPHEVVCVATDTGAEGVTAEASVSYTVAAPTPSYAVTVAEGIENGEVAVDKAEAKAGETVTVTATPDDGYVLEAILVDGEPIGGDSFEMPDHDVTVSATFAPMADYATLPFLADNTPFTGPWQNAKAAGVTVGGLGTDYNSGDGRGARFDNTGDWLQIKFEGTPDELSYVLKGNSISAENVSTFDVLESATGEDGTWTTVASHKSGENLFNNTKTNFTAVLKTDSRFVKFVYTDQAAGNVALYDVYISSGEFSVSFDKEDGFAVEQGTADSLTATVKNGEEPYYFVWTCDKAVELNAEDEGLDTLVIPATLGVGDYTVEVLVFDGQGETANKTISFSVVEPAPKYPVTIDDGILNGNVEAVPAEAAEGDIVTLTAYPEPGYKLGTITVAYNEESFEFTTSPVTFEMPAAAVSVGASFVESHEEIYVPVESADEFVAGEEYLIVAHKDGAFTSALKNTTNGPRIGTDEVTIAADGYVKTDNAGIVWKIQAGEKEGQYVLFNEAASVYAAATRNDNVAQLLEEGTSALAQWTLDLSTLPAVKIVSVSYPNRWLQRNSQVGNDYFATYTGTQTTPMLFKKVASLEFAVNVDKTGFELPLGEGTTVTASAKYGVGDVTYVWTSETEALNGEGAELAIPDMLAEGEYSATVTATDSSAEPQTATADVTFTVVAPAVTYPVNVAIGILHGSVTADKTEAVPGDTVTLTAFPEDGYKLDTFLLNGEPFEGDSFEMPEHEVLVSAEFAAIVTYPVTVDQDIPHGSISADKEEAEAGEIVTLTASPDDGWKLGTFLLNGEEIGGNTFAMPEGEALVSAEFTETVQVTFVPVESASDFVVGEEYLLVAYKEDAYTSAMKNEASGTRIGVDEVTIAEDGSIATDNADIVWTIRAGEGEGQYVLFSATGGVYAAGPDTEGNNAKLVTDGTDDLAQWTLDFSALPEVKVASVSYDGRFLQRNGDKNNKYFATYTGAQVNPLLFKKAGFSVGFDKEDGFTVDEGTADSITAAAVRGVEPYSYEWTSVTPVLNGEGATLAIPDTLMTAEEPYSVTVTATDSSEPPQTASKTITFSVLPPVVRFAVTVADGITGGAVTVDKALAEPGEEVTVTATPAGGYELVDIRVDGEPIQGNTFGMPARDVEVSATFREVVDYATLPFVADQTPYSGPWQKAEVVGLTSSGLGSDYNNGSAKFDDTGDWMQIKFKGTPGDLSYGIKGNGTSATNASWFVVQESADGENWTPVATYATLVPGEGGESVILLTDAKLEEKYTLSEDSRYVKFFYQEKDVGNIGISDVYIGVAGETEPGVTVTGETTVRLGDTFELTLALENYAGGEYAWAWAPETVVAHVVEETSTWWWTPTKIGETEVTFSAMDGERTIASTNVTLTVRGIPALVFEGAPEGVVGEPVTFTVVAENMTDPTVTFMGFLELPEGSGLTDADVVIDFPNVSFKPDVAGDYGLAFSAGTGTDYIEDVWPVRVTAPKPKLVFGGDSEGTVGTPVTFTVEAVNTADPTVRFDEFVSADYSELEEEDVTFDFPNVSFTPDVPGEYYFSFTAGSQEGGDFVVDVLVITVTGETPPSEPPQITNVDVDAAGGWVTLKFTGAGVEVWGTDDLTDADSWVPMEALVEGNTALVEMTKHFLSIR